tara:strand:- start:1385 stop:2761 length:1377 start_codon:yes stop_codon:yes gene_type:complete
MSQFTKPDFLKAGPVMTDATSRIDTDILEPVVQSDTFMRFQFQNKGVLNAGSRVTFSITKPDTESYYPIGVGVGALIERATFKIGGKTICEVQDWGHYHGYESVFMDQSVIKEREQFLSGRALSVGVSYDDGQSVETDRIFLENGKEKVVDTTTATDTQLLMLDLLKLNSEPVFSVRLDDLVPCLKGQELPLFNLMEDVQLELTLTEQAKRVCIASGGDDTKSFSVNTAETRLIADYTFLDGAEMEAYRKSEQGYSYTFLEPRLTKTTLADASAWGNQIRNVGGAGRNVVRAVVSITSEKINASGPIKTALGDYRSIAPESSAKGTYGKLTSNFKKNDRFLYPIDRSNSALHFHGVMDAEGGPPHIARTMYARQGYSLADKKFEGHVVGGVNQKELSGQEFYTGYRFNDGERVDSRGLELHSKLDTMTGAEAPYVSRVWILQEKVMTIVDGKADVMFT